MVNEPYSHRAARLAKHLRELVVRATWAQVSTRMIVAKSNAGSVGKQGFLKNHANIYDGFSESALTYAHSLYQLLRMIHQHHPAFFRRSVTENIVHDVEDVPGCLYRLSFITVFIIATTTEFRGSKNGNSLSRTDAVVLAQFVDGHFAETAQTVVHIMQHTLHELHGTLSSVSATYEYCQKFCVRKYISSMQSKLLARTIFRRPFFYYHDTSLSPPSPLPI